MSRFGICVCGGHLDAEWYEEQESKVTNGMLIWTNRYRRACAVLTCMDCGKNHAVDDTFDGKWYVKQ